MAKSSMIEVMGISVEKGQSTGSGLRLQGRITTTNSQANFENVRICLHGAIRTKTGASTSVEPLSTTTEVKPAADFRPIHTFLVDVDQEMLDFTLALPCISTTSSTSTFLPPLFLSGSTFITCSSALSDRQRVDGTCEVSYWIEASFLSAGNAVMHRATSIVDIASVPLSVSFAQPGNSEHIYQLAKPQSNLVRRYFCSQPQPQTSLSVRIPRQLGPIHWTGKTNRNILLPISVALETHSDSSLPGQASTSCSISARWTTTHSFGQPVITKSHISTQSIKTLLPPFYTSASSNIHTTLTLLDLSVPSSLCNPSTSTTLLNIAYTLELDMRFEIGDLRRTVALKLPVVLSSVADQEMLDRGNPVPGIDDELVLGPPAYYP